MAYDAGLADRVRTILAHTPGVVEQKMFGGIAFMVHGHMCCGVLKTDLVLRLTPEAAAHALRQPHTRPMDFTRQPMKSMIYVNAVGTDLDESLDEWVKTALSIARDRPQKAAKRSRRPAPSS